MLWKGELLQAGSRALSQPGLPFTKIVQEDMVDRCLWGNEPRGGCSFWLCGDET